MSRQLPYPMGMMNEHTRYHIKSKDQLDTRWQDWFDGLTITLTDDGHTILSGIIVDQAALHGVLKKIRNLGLTLTDRLEPVKNRIMQTAMGLRGDLPVLAMGGSDEY